MLISNFTLLKSEEEQLRKNVNLLASTYISRMIFFSGLCINTSVNIIFLDTIWKEKSFSDCSKIFELICGQNDVSIRNIWVEWGNRAESAES